MGALAQLLRIARKVHAIHTNIHHPNHKHIVVGHGLELMGAALSALKWELLANGSLMLGAVVLLAGLFLVPED
jgi:hypothetical protein